MRVRILASVLSLFLLSCNPQPFPTLAPTPGTAERIAELQNHMTQKLPGCVEDLEKRFEKKWEGLEGLSVKLTDKGVDANDRRAGSTIGTTGGISISLRVQFFLSGSQELELTLCHEVVHAYFRNFTAAAAYTLIPTWFREGSAVYLAGQTQAKVLAQLFQNIEAPWTQISGLENPKHGFGDYFEDALAFEFLDLKTGALTAVLLAALNGQEVFAAIEALTGLSKVEFLEQAKQYAVEKIKQQWNEIPELLRTNALHAEDVKKSAYKVGVLEEYLKSKNVSVTPDGHFEGPLTPHEFFAFRLLANQYRLPGGHFDEANRIYQALLTQTPAYTYGGDAGSVRYEWAFLYLGHGEPAAALEQFERVYMEHLESPMLQNASTLGIARAQFDLGNFEQARRWLEPQNLADAYTADEITYRLGISYFKLCHSKGVSILKKLSKSETRGIWIDQAREALTRIAAGTLTAPGCKK